MRLAVLLVLCSSLALAQEPTPAGTAAISEPSKSTASSFRSSAP